MSRSKGCFCFQARAILSPPDGALQPALPRLLAIPRGIYQVAWGVLHSPLIHKVHGGP